MTLPGAAAAPGSRGRLTWRAYLLVVGVALAASANTLRNGFVYDDVPIVVEDQRIHAGPLTRAITEQYWPSSFGDYQLYRPLTSLTFAADWRASGGRPLLFHAENLAIHLGVVALVLMLAGLVLPPAGAVVAGLWFAVQPIHAEAVANIVGRAELLAALFYLLAVTAYLRAGAPGVAAWKRALLWLAVFACALLADGSKEHALTLPAALLLADVAAARAAGEPFRARLARSWPAWAAATAAAAVFLLARFHATHAGFGSAQIAAGLQDKDAVERFIAMLPAYAAWARLFLVPWRLSADYAPDALRPVVQLTAAHLLGLAAVGGALAAAWWGRRRAPAITLGILWIVITGSVAANVVVPTGVLLAERTLYLSSAGAAVALGGAWLLLTRDPPRRWLWPATALVIALLGARTVERDTLWRDNAQFFERLATDAPDSYRSHWMRGTWAFRRKQFAEGERLYREALAIYPYDASLVAELGMWYLDARLWDPADRYLTLALRMDTSLSEAAVKAVFARNEAGRNDSADALARVALARWPQRVDVMLVAIRAEQLGGHPADAAAVARRLVAEDSTRWEYLQIAGDAAARAGRCDEARTLITRAEAKAPRAEPAPHRLLAQIGAGPDCAARIP